MQHQPKRDSFRPAGPRKRILKEMAAEQELLVGMIQQLPHADATEAAALGGLDFVIFDLEHTGFDIVSALPSIGIAAAYNLPFLIRVREKEQALIEQALDAGAQGVLVPTIETVADCELVVRSARFAPEGERGWCPVSPAKRWMNFDDPDDYDPLTYGAMANSKVFVAVLVETPLGIKNLPEMLKVPGIDAFFIGAGDLSSRMGRSMWDPEVAAIVADAINQINVAGKISCPVALPANIAELHKKGARMITLGINERGILINTLRSTIGQIRQIVSETV